LKDFIYSNGTFKINFEVFSYKLERKEKWLKNLYMK
jgi:hypothetical protein